MRWNVKLWGITWDGGKGEYDVSDLPANLEILNIAADDEGAAIEYAMSDASASYGSLIEGVGTAEIVRLPERRRT